MNNWKPRKTAIQFYLLQLDQKQLDSTALSAVALYSSQSMTEQMGKGEGLGNLP